MAAGLQGCMQRLHLFVQFICMWAALIGFAVCSGWVVNFWMRKHPLASLHHALPHSGLYFREPSSMARSQSSAPCPMCLGCAMCTFAFCVFVARLGRPTWIQVGILKEAYSLSGTCRVSNMNTAANILPCVDVTFWDMLTVIMFFKCNSAWFYLSSQ